jgi:hypothetical protein
MALKDIISYFGVGALILLLGDEAPFPCLIKMIKQRMGMPCIILS